ncbi:MAG: lysostaphin resistance A-like protein [Candidatus Cryptobacteroides sp.]
MELILGSILFAVLYSLGMGLLSIPQPAAKCAAITVAAIVILAMFPLWNKLFEKQWRWDLLTINAGKNLLYGISTGFLFFVVLFCILYVTGCCHVHYASPHWSYILVNLCFYFLVACGEEVIFRGIIFRMIDDRFGLWWALGISALIFGLVHIINPGASIWSSVAIAIEAGVLLGVAYKYTDSLIFPIGIHWAWNFTQGNIFGFAVSGGDAEESILTATLSGPEIITGGSFGPEASIITIILGTILSVIFMRKILKRQAS